MKYDFSGYATRSNVRCTDGRVILPNAFSDNDGKSVPLVFQHNHNAIDNVLGKVTLENRDDGVYCYGTFNKTQAGQDAKIAVEHGDMNSLSIYANKVQEHRTKDANVVSHGEIKEVSLVFAGANPGAFIDNLTIEHSDGTESDDEVIIFSGLELSHEDEDEDTLEHSKKSNEDDEEDEYEDDSDEDEDDSDEDDEEVSEKKPAPRFKKKDSKIEHADDSNDEGDDDDMVIDVLNSLNDKQSAVVMGLIGIAMDQDPEDDDEEDSDNAASDKNSDKAVEHSAEEGVDMDHNIFEKNGIAAEGGVTLSHEDQENIMKAAATDASGSFRKYVIAHAQDYGIKNIDVFFPDAVTVRDEPDMYKRDTEWVANVLTNTHHTPFARIRSQYVDLTDEAARAKGFTLDRDNNRRKKDEMIKAFKRVTTPSTIYKKQKLDRDDVVDITSFDVVNFLMREMRIMLDEEVARAILIGDGREPTSEDHINEESIRPIVSDDDLYVIRSTGEADETLTDLVDRIRKSRTGYYGSGQPTAYLSPTTHAELITQRDQMKHRLYDNDAALASDLGVSAIVEVPQLEGFKDEDGKLVQAIIVNLRDYTVGTNKGGEITNFSDFDIDYNQHKYLLETRMSGALTLPKSAIVVRATPKA